MEESKPTTTKDIIFSLIAIAVIFIIAFFIFESIEQRHVKREKPLKFDYYMEITVDNIYVIDKTRDTIYTEKMNWKNPGKLQQALMNYNSEGITVK